ncbi:MAG TPA: trehalose-phosphatase [Polyangia bacterium]|nr:trehalose-phosphatase [Polyangia bacterium]
MRHWDPSLVEWARGRAHLHVFADFDGTLAPIAPRPDLSSLPERARAALERLVARPRTAVAMVSGRPADTLARLVPVAGVIYVGNHGMEVASANGRWEDPIAAAARPAVERLGARIAELAAQTPGAVLERKGLSLSLHTRLVEDEDRRERLERAVARLADAEPALARSGGKRIVELRPRGAANKGSAALRLLAEAHGADWPRDCAAIFLGDDVTDEDGFRALAAHGAGVLVLDGPARETSANFRADSVDDAHALLEALAAM